MQGVIYEICHLTDLESKVYIGSSFIPLRRRLRQHKNDFQKYIASGNPKYFTSSFKLFSDYGPENFTIKPLLETEVESKKDLKKIEGEYIRNCPNKVNMKIPGRTQKEYQNERVICPHCQGNYSRSSLRKHLKRHSSTN